MPPTSLLKPSVETDHSTKLRVLQIRVGVGTDVNAVIPNDFRRSREVVKNLILSAMIDVTGARRALSLTGMSDVVTPGKKCL